MTGRTGEINDDSEDKEVYIPTGNEGAFFMRKETLYQVRTIENGTVRATRVNYFDKNDEVIILLSRSEYVLLINQYMTNST